MSHHFSCSFTTRGTKCYNSKCERVIISKGDLRITRTTANGSSVHFHPACALLVQEHAKPGMSVIGGASDIQGLDKLPKAEQKALRDLVTGKTSAKSAVAKATKAAAASRRRGRSAGAAVASSDDGRPSPSKRGRTKKKAAAAPSAKGKGPAPKQGKTKQSPARKASPRKAAAAAASSADSSSKKGLLAGCSICITGALSRLRKDVIRMIEERGGRYCKSVTQSTTHLVCSNPYQTTVKMNKAKQMGIIVVGEQFLNTGKQAVVFDRSNSVAGAALKAKAEWQFFDQTWKPYDASAQDVMEAAYADWQKDQFVNNRPVKSGVWIYLVDFKNMTQTNAQHHAHTQRRIRRSV